MTHLSRRSAMLGASSLATPFLSTRSRAQASRDGKTFLVSLPDAGVEKVVRDKIVPIIKAKYNANIRTQQGSSGIVLSQLRVQKRAPPAIMVTLDLGFAVQALHEDLIEPVSVVKVPNLKDTMPKALAEDGQLTSFILSTDTLIFNGKKWDPILASVAEMFAPAKIDAVAIPDASSNIGLEFLVVAASAATGKPIKDCLDMPEEGIRFLGKHKGQFRMIYSRSQEVMPLVVSGEVSMCFNKTRFLTEWVQRKAPVDCVIPKEGAFYSLNCICPVKNSPDPELGMAFIDVMLSPEIQQMWPNEIGSASVNRTVNVQTQPEFARIVPTVQQLAELSLLPQYTQARMTDLTRMFNQLVAQ